MIILERDFRAYCATGDGGGIDNSCAAGAANDKTWMSGDETSSTSWDADQLAVRSPIRGGDKIASVRIENSSLVVSAMKSADITVDEVISIGGGPVRGSHITVRADSENQISVGIIAPVDPEDPSQGVISSDVEIIRDEDEDGAFAIHYGTLFPMREVKIDDRSGEAYAVGDVSPSQLTASQRNRIASILMERFAESVSVAEKSGFAYAEMLAVGTAHDDSDKGYRLWPQFGFDGDIPTTTLKSIPDEIALKAVGVKVPPPGASRIPHETVLKSLRATTVSRITIQQLISTPEGDRWWNENGHSVSLRLDLRDKSSAGYKRFSEMKAKIAKLRERNKKRSLLDFYHDVIERRGAFSIPDGRDFCPTGNSEADESPRLKSDTAEARGDAKAPPKDRIKGSDTNEEGSAKNQSGEITLDESTVASLKAKAEEHNADMRERGRPEWTHVRLPALKAVYRRGAGAFSTSHRPGMTRDRWAMARVNAFLYLARRGRPENAKYVGDNDLLSSEHPRYSKQSRSVDCGRDESGRFGSGNDCASDGSGSSGSSELSDETGESTISSTSSVRIKSGKDWKKADDIVMYRGKDIPAKSLAGAESVSLVHGKLMSGALKDLGVTLDDAARMCAATQDGATIVASHGLLSDVEAYFDNPEDPPESHTAVTFFSKVDIGGIDNAVAVGTTLALADDDTLVLSYGMLDVTPEAKDASPVAIAREMYRSVAASIGEAEKAGVSEVEMLAAGSGDSGDRFRGYRIWPRMGFDGVIPRARITPTYTLMYGFFNSYGSSIPDSILSPRAIKEKKAGSLTVQALYETPEGQDWWEKNGGAMEMRLSIEDKNSPGWKRFSAMREKLSRRYLSVGDDEYLDWIDFEWRSLIATGVVEFRDDCGRTPDGKFGPKNDCAGDEGDAAPAEGKKPAGTKSPAKQDSLRWKSGEQHPDAFDEVRRSPPVSRDATGRLSSTTYSPDDISSFAGKQYASPEAVGRYLTGVTASHRGRPIDSSKELSGDDFEFMVSSLSQQVQSATSRGHTPAFYSQDELKKQIDDYAQLHPVLRGGKTASGVCIGKVDSDGNCQQTDSITPEGEFLFRAVQALTSPQANPWLNMQRADDVITHFLTETDPKKARLENAPVGGNVMQVTRGSLTRLQAIIDKAGLTGAAEIFSGPPMRAGEIEKFFKERLGIEGLSPGGYSVDEVVPVFSIFGPKVGPFFANNNGDHEQLTADVWFTRTWGRLTGELISETSPDLAKAHAKELLSPSRLKHITEEDLGGVSVEDFAKSLEVMKKTGEVPASIQGWAEARFKRYGKEGFNKGTKGVRNQEVARLSRRILQNLVKVNDQPDTTVQRSNMIKVMREVAKRTGLPQAYCQDLLWQDEQDIWGAAGARTFTDVGEPSLYSTGIEKMVKDQSLRLPVKKAAEKAKKKSKRSLDQQQEESGDIVWIGDYEQLLFEDELQDVTPEEFADAFIGFFSRESTAQSRNFAALDFGASVSAFVGGILAAAGIEGRDGGCGANAPGGGGFQDANTCGAIGGTGASANKSVASISKLAKSNASHEKLQLAIEDAIVGRSTFFGGYKPGAASAKEVISSLGLNVSNADDIDTLLKNSRDDERRAIAGAIAAIHRAGGLPESGVRIDTAKSVASFVGGSASEFDGVDGVYFPATDTVHVIAGATEIPERELYESGYSSTPDESHVVVHELAHQAHYYEASRDLGLETPSESWSDSDRTQWARHVSDFVEYEVAKVAVKDPEWAERVARKAIDTSFYASTDPWEAVAEYSTAVKLGFSQNDRDLDRLCKAMHAPVPKRMPK